MPPVEEQYDPDGDIFVQAFDRVRLPAELILRAFIVPRMRLELTRPFRAKGFSYHYGFRHHFCLWSGLFLHHGSLLFRCAVSSLCTFLFSEAWLKIAFSVTC